MSDVLQTGKVVQPAILHTPTCLAGWCKVGSMVLTDYYLAEADLPREVERIHLWPGKHPSACVWTKGSPEVRPLIGIDFDLWIKKPPE